MGQRIKTQEEKDFIDFVVNNCGCPDGGTATSYEAALYVLNCALRESRPNWISDVDVWSVLNIDELKYLYEKVLLEQRAYIKRGAGIFSAIKDKDLGRSYYEKRWCSAAVAYLIRFRESQKLTSEYESKLEKAITGHTMPEVAARNASRIKLVNQKCFVPKGMNPLSKAGKEVIRQVKVRCNQNVFRRAVLNNYSYKCCVCGIASPQLLDAAHISEWSADLSNALDVTNGLCLSATYHRAFDAHLIGFDDQYRMKLTKTLRDTCTKDVYRRYFKGFENQKISMPHGPLPSKDALLSHLMLLVD